MNQEYIKEAGQEGAEAYRVGQTLDQCPYHKGTGQWRAWTNRWLAKQFHAKTEFIPVKLAG